MNSHKQHPLSYSYDHNQEKQYMSSISDVFQQAEEETRKAEALLAKWKKDTNKSNRENETIQNQENDLNIINRKMNNRQNQARHSQQASTKAGSFVNSNTNIMMIVGPDEVNEKQVRNRLNYTGDQFPASHQRTLNNQQLQQQQPSKFPEQKQKLNINNNISIFDRSLPTKFLDQSSQQDILQKSLNPQILDEVSLCYQTEQSKDNRIDSKSQSRKQLDQSMVNGSNGINKDQFSSLKSHKSLTGQDYSESDFTQNDYKQKRNNEGLQDLDISKETDLIQLDKHYKQLLKSEREEYNKNVQKQVNQAYKDAEKKYKAQINELKSKFEENESLEVSYSKLKINCDKLNKENEQLKKRLRTSESKNTKSEEMAKKLQKKLDDLWERQQAEKENAKLIAKYEAEQESRQKIEEMTRKIIQLESQLRDQSLKLSEYDSMKRQMDKIKRELNDQCLNKSQEKIQECEIQMLKQQYKLLSDQICSLETENSKLRQNQSIIESTNSHQNGLLEKYENLKKKFAIAVKEKEMLEKNKLQETANFKTLNQDCLNCDTWKVRAQELAEKYFVILQSLRTELDQMRQSTRSSLINAQKDLHGIMIAKLRDYLDETRANENITKHKSLIPSGHYEKRKNSVNVVNKSQTLVLEPVNSMTGTDRQHQYMKTLDHRETTAKTTKKKKKHHLILNIQAKIDQAHNKTIVESTKNQRKKSEPIRSKSQPKKHRKAKTELKPSAVQVSLRNFNNLNRML